MLKVQNNNMRKEAIWTNFNSRAKNSLFMFDRKYMDYHKDRFEDHSLLFYDEEKLIALLPMNIKGNELVSHGGLTYGGFISDDKMKQHTMNDCFKALISYAKDIGIKKIKYKCIPHIYHTQAAEEDRFALFANGAKLINVDVSTYLNLSTPLKMPKGRKAQISRAKREGVIVEELTGSEDFEAFIDLENSVLTKRYQVKAVHSGEELKMLHDKLPDNIHLFSAKKEGRLIAGTVVYEYDQVIHTQYMAADDEARIIGALDLTVATIISKYKESKKWLDFGISTEHNEEAYLNEGLCSQKEGFGGRTGVYELWELGIQ